MDAVDEERCGLLVRGEVGEVGEGRPEGRRREYGGGSVCMVPLGFLSAGGVLLRWLVGLGKYEGEVEKNKEK